jgi:hypothetical protein
MSHSPENFASLSQACIPLREFGAQIQCPGCLDENAWMFE